MCKIDVEQLHKKFAVDFFNGTWDLIDKKDRTKEEIFEMIHMAHASRCHWGKIGGPLEFARGEWQISRVYSLAGLGESALFHGEYSLELCEKNGIGDFDLAFGFEAVARAYKLLGNEEKKEQYILKARQASEHIEDEGNKKYLLSELETI